MRIVPPRYPLRFRKLSIATLKAASLLGLTFWPAGSVAEAAQKPPAAADVDFNRDIAPIFQAKCVQCHNSNVAQGKLRLDSAVETLKGGKSGTAIIPGKSADSILIKRMLGTNDAPRMPLGGDALSADQINLVRSWIDHADFASIQASAVQAATEADAGHAGAAKEASLFAEKVRPILASRCYQCHGPNMQENGLRLDSLAAIMKGSESGKVVIPGKGGDSRLMHRLTAQDRPRMPFGAPPLSNEQISVVRQWIDEGAPGPDSTASLPSTKPLKHWAYVKPERPAEPSVKNAAWSRNPIDRFILARLEKEGLSPAREADKPTLLRRVYLDLIGLPPTPQQVDAFVADKRPDAYERVVDQLLASPRYGERWAGPWLDLARYADTNGYEKDGRRTAWKFRDWVINALNQNMSFKEFTVEQIASDMLPNPTKNQLVATGFHRNTMLNQEGGVDPEEYYWYSQVDRVNTTASVWLGSTLACAQCHNHKFDPFTHKDYYRFLAFFNNVKYEINETPSTGRHALEAELELPTPEQAAKSKELRAEIAKLQTVLDTTTPELEAAQAKWETEIKSADQNWTVLQPDQFTSKGGATLKVLPDASILAGDKNPQADRYTIEAKTKLTGITAVRIEVLNDASLPKGGPGRDPDGNFFLSDFEVQAVPADGSGRAEQIIFKGASANDAQKGYEVKNLLRKESSTTLRGWAIDAAPSDVPLPRQAVLIAKQPFGFSGGTALTIRMKHEMRFSSRNVGRLRLSVTSAKDPAEIVKLPVRMWPILTLAPAQRTADQKNKLAAAYREISPLLQPSRDRIAQLEKSTKQLGIVTAMVMEEQPNSKVPATFIRERGSFMSKGEEVHADVPAVLNPLTKDQKPNRLALAQWLVSDDNPLTARVTVNRYWQSFFGHGIVETSEDFGTQGDLPTHPQLLDWLATEFMRQGWDMKAIKRLIVTSATYRQSSHVTPEMQARDPYNKLFARGSRFRVESEMVHDIALSASGLLSSKLGGPSVFPYQPDGVWDVPYSTDKWIISEGEDRYRRSLYTFLRRSSPYPSMITFDAPSREFCTVRRVRTNTPLQALTTLNDPYFFDAARALAKRIVQETGATDPTSRTTYGFRLCASRRPTQAEVDRLVSFYNKQLDLYQTDPKAASKVIQVTSNSAPDAPELAAWTMVSNVLLNMDETVSKE